jgi:hypothetical protein
LNKIIDKIDDKLVDWKKVSLKPMNGFQKNINNNETIEACRKMGLKMIGVNGKDITDGDSKFILSLLKQIAKKYSFKIVQGKNDIDISNFLNKAFKIICGCWIKIC